MTADIRTTPGMRGTVHVWAGTVRLGEVFPVVVAQPAGAWYARRPGKTAVWFISYRRAYEWLTGQNGEAS